VQQPEKKESGASRAESGASEEHLASLVAAAQGGSVAAFEKLAGRHYRDLYGFAMTFVGNPAEASDVAQEALIKAFRKLPSYRYQASFRTWLLQIARNAFYDRIRKERQHRRKLDRYRDQMTEGAGSDPERELMAKQTRVLVYRALYAIPPGFREVVVLFDLNGLSYQEIADVCSIPLGTVKSRLRRGRDALRAELAAANAERTGGSGVDPDQG
jgi:RNA polymerase sigma-70 factor (ECF subfamily)